MQRRQRKIVVLGAVLIAASFLVGLLYSFLPVLSLNLLAIACEFLIFFCYGLSGILFLALATLVFTIAAVFHNPFGVMFMLGTLWILISRKPKVIN
ncbi:MAG: hypothetical protein K2Y39_05515 [Candidatus Obscuribacterales bacterium]|nr:hypothetical protein [Candidatus Obscuribacterales bacterium]